MTALCRLKSALYKPIAALYCPSIWGNASHNIYHLLHPLNQSLRTGATCCNHGCSARFGPFSGQYISALPADAFFPLTHHRPQPQRRSRGSTVFSPDVLPLSSPLIFFFPSALPLCTTPANPPLSPPPIPNLRATAPLGAPPPPNRLPPPARTHRHRAPPHLLRPLPLPRLAPCPAAGL